MLRDMAANRGCKLVKSRRRKAGGDFGRYGLKDGKTGQEVFGFGDDGLTASAEQIEQWLRGGAVAEWKRSLTAAAGAPQTRAKAKERPKPANDAAADPAPRRKSVRPSRPSPPPPPPPPRPKLVIREAKPGDAEAVAGLLAELGPADGAGGVKKRIAAMAKAKEPVLVADEGGVIGCLAWTIWTPLDRAERIGRITLVVVAKKARYRGVGSALLAEAEARFRKAGCGTAEVTAAIDLGGAQDFYRREQYERTSWRFAKSLK